MDSDESGPPPPGPSHLPPGDYEVMVVDVDRQVDDHRDPSGCEQVQLSLVVLKGPLKGQVVDLGYPSGGPDLLGLLGTLGTLTATHEGLVLRLED